MSLVGTLLFCTDCGNLLDRVPPQTLLIACECCQALNPKKWSPILPTSSKPTAFPSTLRDKRGDIRVLGDKHVETWAETREACPVCENTKTLFREMQMRNADEGSTLFFRCVECGHRWKLDN